MGGGRYFYGNSRGVGGFLFEIPSVVGVWIFSGTTHCIFFSSTGTCIIIVKKVFPFAVALLHCCTCNCMQFLLLLSILGRYDIHHKRYHKILSTADADIVAQSGFWPGSITDATYLFHLDLLLHWDILQKQIPGISERAFIKLLELFSKQKGRVRIEIDLNFFHVTVTSLLLKT